MPFIFKIRPPGSTVHTKDNSLSKVTVRGMAAIKFQRLEAAVQRALNGETDWGCRDNMVERESQDTRSAYNITKKPNLLIKGRKPICVSGPG